MGMSENYKHLYKQMKKMVTLYQDEIVPGMREQLEKCVEVVRCKDCKHEKKCLMCVEIIGDTPLTTSSRHIDFCSYGERKDNG